MKRKGSVIGIVVVAVALLVMIIFVLGDKQSDSLPWEESGISPTEYTIEDYNVLTESQKKEFQQTFGNEEAFEAWKREAESNQIKVPWENGDKKVVDYTWKDFEELSGEQQIAFQQAFESEKSFEEWVNKAQMEAIEKPWETGDKKVTDYTWKEFEKLSGPQQIAFQKAFESEEAFEEWMNETQTKEIKKPWETGEKKVTDYTWEEFEELSGEQQIAFQQAFESEDAFEEWMNSVKND